MAWLMDSAVRLRRLVVAAIVAVLALGLVQLQRATVDVYPEFESTAVQVQTDALGLSAYEVEQLITVPLEQNLLNGIPRLEEIRSRSMSGLSVVDLTFEAGTDIYLARQLVQERMGRINLLPNVGTPPTMIQPTASTSRVAMVGLRSDSVSMVDISVLAKWTLRPRLMSIPGVAAVSVWGLRDRQLQVQVDPERLVASNVTLTQVIQTTGNALWVSPLSFLHASTPGTGGFYESPNQRIGVQHVSPITTSEQLADVTLQRAGGPPLRLGDLADVKEDHQPLIGDASNNGAQSLMLVVERFPDANTAQVSKDVEEALEAMAPGLTGITVDTTVYQPAQYLDTALERLGLAVLIGLALMVAAIAVVALSWRVALITLGSVAVSLVGALWVLHLRGSTLTTMTVIGLATVMALVIDDAVGDVSDMRARFDERLAAGDSAVVALASGALRARRSALVYATVIVLVALAPVLLLDGTAGAFAGPAILTFALAALTSLVAGLVVTPVLAVLLLGGRAARPGRVAPFAGWVGRGVDRAVAPSTGRRVPALVALGVLVALGLGGVVSMRPGDMLPELRDRNVLVRLAAAPGTALTEMNRITGRAAEELRNVPGVQTAGTHVGRAVGSDAVVDVDASEIWLTIDDDADYSQTLAAVRNTVNGYPGLRNEVRTYGQAQLEAASASSGDDLVVRVYGQDFATLQETAEIVRDAMATVHGVISPTVESQPAQPVAEIHVDLPAAQRLGLQPGDVRRAASTLVSGLTVGNLYERQAIFDVVVWGGPASRQSVLDIQDIRIDTPSGAQVRLGEVARVEQTSDPAAIEHHATSRSLDVTARVQGRDYAEIAQDATTRLQQLNYPYEYRAEVVGDAGDRSNLQQALLLGAIVAAVLIFLLFQAATGSWRGAAVLFVLTPLAGVGGVLAGMLLGGTWSLAVVAAIFAAVALTVRQTLVLVRRAGALGASGEGRPADGMLRALQEKAPSLLAAVLVTAAAFLPAAVMGPGAGLELLQPFAITLLAGLVTVVLVVLLLVPVLYPAAGALVPAGGSDDDPENDPDDDAGRVDARHARDGLPTQRRAGEQAAHQPTVDQKKKGQAMQRTRSARTHRSVGITALFLAAGLGVTGCSTPAQSAATAGGEEPAVVEPVSDGGPARLTLSAEAELRLGVETVAVTTAPQLSVPYAAVVYDGQGAAWAFARVDERTYQRTPITVADITGDVALLSAGPSAGTEVVTVGAAELVGVEAGISGGE